MEEQFNRIFDMYNKDIFRLIFSYNLNYEDSKDILQEVFLKYYNKIANVPNDDTQIKKWLVSVAINKIKDYHKSYWCKKIIGLKENNLSNVIFDSNLELIDTLNNIDKKYRIPIYLYYYEGYSISEISNILKISESAVKMRLSRAKQSLKLEMESKDEKF